MSLLKSPHTTAYDCMNHIERHMAEIKQFIQMSFSQGGSSGKSPMPLHIKLTLKPRNKVPTTM